MRIKIEATIPNDQIIEAKCFYDKDFKGYLFNLYVEHRMPGENRKPIGEELTLCIQNQEQVEELITLIRKAAKKIKGKGKKELASSTKSGDDTAS